ncbi:phosphopantothenoylcysteine decarboxylase [Anthonomus grandis grandis]|uniref:phosphopantothenoylcysteine decarboxylase n=1 Tax=Anthonomus grandis grandis TaxID=2921223 RepID=UPI00216602B0|nr:phosphopantothenoylcysteine decarboxylase [Anthonomus grandis grandis]
MVNVLIGCTGSVATLKLPNLIQEILREIHGSKIRVVVTEHSKHFFDPKDLPEEIDIFNDKDEWNSWQKRGDEVLHIELGKWADVFLIAPLDANCLGKLTSGICDNLLLCTARAWELGKPLLFCPAMNTKMYNHPLTAAQISTLKSWGYTEIPAIAKTLICGDTGLGAMAEVADIVCAVKSVLERV